MTPKHIAIIMDGNGRWAKKRGLPVNAGHRAGAAALRKLGEAAAKAGIEHLTVYAFSTENWNRPKEEVDGLMRLLREYLQTYIADAKKKDVRVDIIGDIGRLDDSLQSKIRELTAVTADKTGLRLHIALNYGARDELVRAVRKIALKVRDEAVSPESIDEAFLARHLDTGSFPDPEIIIRTGGESRLSNFLLWQAAYSELYITETLWPDFGAKELQRVLEWYSEVDRRFGGRV